MDQKFRAHLYKLMPTVNRHVYLLLAKTFFQSDLIWRNMKWKCSTVFGNLESDIFLKHLFWFSEFSAEFLFFYHATQHFIIRKNNSAACFSDFLVLTHFSILHFFRNQKQNVKIWREGVNIIFKMPTWIFWIFLPY